MIIDGFDGARNAFNKLLPKITSLMTDRAAAMKLFYKKFQEFVQSQTDRYKCSLLKLYRPYFTGPEYPL